MAKFKVVESKQFIKAYKKLSEKDKNLTDFVLDLLRENENLPEKYRDHQLKGELREFRECHIRGDLLLLYRKRQQILTITAINVGSHNQIFDDK